MKYHFISHRIDIQENDTIEICDAAGGFYLVPFSVDNLSLTDVKQICENFEENHLLGRFVDVDLNDQQGNSVSSGKSKLCFFCRQRPAIECRRENTHGFDELRSFMFSEMAEYSRKQRSEMIAKKLSSLAQQAILQEISLTPKPGLVDKFSSGSHKDMNYQTFIESTAAISPWFGELVLAGFSLQDSDLAQALPIVRNIGIRIEAAMFESTRNVNTQKGIIFLMGLSLFACGKLFRESDHFQASEFRGIIQGICKDLVKNELQEISKPAKSHGEKTFLEYGISGARGEAESGFETVFNFGLPQILQSEQPDNEALIKCFLAIAANNDDTNILYRSNPDVLKSFKNLCRIALKDFNPENYQAVIDFCKHQNISPGGSADLLAVTIFVRLVVQADTQEHFTF